MWALHKRLKHMMKKVLFWWVSSIFYCFQPACASMHLLVKIQNIPIPYPPALQTPFHNPLLPSPWNRFHNPLLPSPLNRFQTRLVCPGSTLRRVRVRTASLRADFGFWSEQFSSLPHRPGPQANSWRIFIGCLSGTVTTWLPGHPIARDSNGVLPRLDSFS